MFQALIKTLLEASYMDVETQDLRSEGMLGGEVLRAPDALLPGSIGHRAIIGLRHKNMQPSGLGFHLQIKVRLALTVHLLWDYSFVKSGVRPFG